MDFERLTNDFSIFGNVNYLNYNGEDTERILIVISDFNNSVMNMRSYNDLVAIEIAPLYPKTEFSIRDNVLKAEYFKS